MVGVLPILRNTFKHGTARYLVHIASSSVSDQMVVRLDSLSLVESSATTKGCSDNMGKSPRKGSGGGGHLSLHVPLLTSPATLIGVAWQVAVGSHLGGTVNPTLIG